MEDYYARRPSEVSPRRDGIITLGLHAAPLFPPPDGTRDVRREKLDARSEKLDAIKRDADAKRHFPEWSFWRTK